MQRALPLLNGHISLSTALVDDDNVLQELSYPERRLGFYTCRVGEVKEWIAGSFNVCVQVDIDGQDHNAPKRVLIRFPLLYNIRQNCPSIPIPRLRVFAFAQGPCFAAIEHTSIFSRLKWYIYRVVSSIFRYPHRPPYLSRNCPFNLTTGYLIMDHRRTTLFRGLSQIILSLAQKPFGRIGSLTINNQGIIKHTNRPLTLRLHHLDNESVPTNMDRDFTYSTSDSYLMDLLSYHNSRLRYAPNRNKAGEAQLSTLTIMRALLPHFSYRDYRRGPFIMTLTDLHQSNLFVDGDWNIKSLVDLEWTCSLPVEMLHPPYWLTSRGAHSQAGHKTFGYTSIMRKGWEIGNFWYFHALETHKGLYNIFLEHIQPMFSKLDDAGMVKFERTISPYWALDVQEFLDGKIEDKEIYEGHLHDTFAVVQEGPPKFGSCSTS
ncbi:hypothetical protein BJX64DRAFT_281883 [Aspergillus heterothallicus]